ncbi:hypothetical protein [Allosphingosinicella vermicomposti]|nr:hypothetical protein [Allosphingosinicella vermicomposti]
MGHGHANALVAHMLSEDKGLSLPCFRVAGQRPPRRPPDGRIRRKLRI